MSEATARARQPIDLEEFERRLRGSVAGVPFERARIEPQTLSDFARLMGSAEADAARALAPADPYVAPNPYAPSPASQQTYAPADYAPGNASPAPYEPYPAFDPPVPQSDLAAVVDDYPNAGSRFAQEPQQAAAYWDERQANAAEESSEKRSRTPALLIGAAVAICVVGIGATLAMRGGSAPGGEAPTIKAAAGPVKIQPEQPKGGAQPAQSASILDRNDSERIAASRVVNREEQPIDIREAARAARVEAAAPAAGKSAPAGAGFFPEPRKVKTVSVRPDGSIVNEPVAPVVRPPSMASAPAPTTASAPAARTPASAPSAPVRPVSAPPAPVAPKVTARATPPVPTIGDNAPRNLAPVAAGATPSAANPPAGSGAFAVQLAAPGSVAEANVVIARLKQRHAAELGGAQPVSVRANVNGKDIYRVRVTGLSQDGANALCNRLKAGGGSCFVARN
jgi:hypothetical protein